MNIEHYADRPLTWLKSSYSGGEGGNCVEVAAAPTAVHIRDSKDPDGGILSVSPESWSAFIEFARHATV
jgi:hypothetical protein